MFLLSVRTRFRSSVSFFEPTLLFLERKRIRLVTHSIQRQRENSEGLARSEVIFFFFVERRNRF